MATTYGPYTPARRAGDLLFVSGQVGIDPETKTASTNITKQTRQVMQNMEGVIQNAGFSFQDIVKTTVFLTNMDNLPQMNLVYEQVFAAPRPARSVVAVKELPRVAGPVPLLIEIEAVAYKEQV